MTTKSPNAMPAVATRAATIVGINHAAIVSAQRLVVRKKNVIRCAVVLLVLVSWCAPIAEADRVHIRISRDSYAAIAYSPATGRYAYAYNYRSRPGAQNEALRRCGAEDALIACWVNEGVCALALGDDKTCWGAGWCYGSGTDLDAKERALAQCRGTGTTGCHIVLCLSSDGQYMYQPK